MRPALWNTHIMHRTDCSGTLSPCDENEFCTSLMVNSCGSPEGSMLRYGSIPLKTCAFPISSSRLPVFTQFFMKRRLLLLDCTGLSVACRVSVMVISTTSRVKSESFRKLYSGTHIESRFRQIYLKTGLNLENFTHLCRK